MRAAQTIILLIILFCGGAALGIFIDYILEEKFPTLFDVLYSSVLFIVFVILFFITIKKSYE